VVDEGLVSSRKPADIPAFSRKMIEEIEAGWHRKSRGVASAAAQ
jgi:protease I